MQSAALTPLILFAAIEIPTPVVQTKIPKSTSLLTTAFATACPYFG